MPRVSFLFAAALIWNAAFPGACAHAMDFSLGSGLSSVTEGRAVPLLHAGVHGKDHALTGYITGVRTSVYYQSSYQLSFLWTWKPGEFLWGDITAGFGFGGFASSRGYRDNPSAEVARHYDFTAGPDILISWKMLGPLYISIEALFGLRSPWSIIFLAPQDAVNLAIGVKL